MQKKLLITITICALAALAGCAYYAFHRQNTPRKPVLQNGVNYSPPTESEKQAANDIKDTIVNSQQNNQSTDGKTKASVIITDAAQYENTIEVRSFIPNHYEDGTCTITFTHQNLKVQKTAPAYRDASSTICTNPLVGRSEFTATGEWAVIVSYTSEHANGTSEAKTLTVK